jgi:hypothetical protein
MQLTTLNYSKVLARTLFIGSLLALVGSGCANNSGSSNNNNGNPTRAPVTGTASNTASIPQTPTAGSSLVQLTGVPNVTAASQQLFTAAGQPGVLGDIDPTNSPGTGISFYGSFFFPAANAQAGGSTRSLDSANSYLVVRFTDSYAVSGKTTFLPYEIGKNSYSQGSVSTDTSGHLLGSVNINFADAFGNQIILSGQTSAGNTTTSVFTGTMSIVPAGANGVQTALGQFSVPTCNIFNCN